MIYVDNAATSFYKPECVKQAIMDYLSHPGNPDRGSHFSSLQASRIVLNTRLLIQSYLDAPSFERVIFTSGITESLNIVIQGLIDEKDHVITSYLEHNSVLRPLYKMECDLSITDGSVEQIESCIQSNTKAVIINHVSNVTGEIQDIASIGKLCKEKNILFIVDAAQSAGVLPISMKKDNIDILCFTGHKGLMGIQGIGGFCFGCDVEIPSFKVGGSGIHSFLKEQPKEYPTRLEAGTLNVPGILSLYEGIQFVQDKEIYKHEMGLRNAFMKGIQSLENVILYQNTSKESVGIVSLNIKGMDASKISDCLCVNYGIETRSGAHCAPLVLDHYGIESMVRFSFGYHNTLDDVDMCIQAIKDLERSNG